MILVDTSAFIEYYRPDGRPEVRAAVAEAIATDQAAVNGIVQTELLPLALREADRARLVADFLAYHWLDLTRSDFDLAADLGFRLRRLGLTIPATDLIIAASAIGAGATLYHLDGHFDALAEHSALAARRLDGSAAG